MSVLNCFQSQATAVASIILFQGHRIYTYGMAAAFLQATFPPGQFGSLMGIGRVVIGITSLINLPIIAAMESMRSFIIAYLSMF